MESTRIDWVREHCRLLQAISAEFTRTRPFDGLTIGTGIHLVAKTVTLLLTLRDGGPGWSRPATSTPPWTGSTRRLRDARPRGGGRRPGMAG